jgi:hypothetical protein
MVESWVELTEVRPPFVSVQQSFVFEADGTVATSDSTLRFRDRGEIADALNAAGFILREVRDAPDRPGLEVVFIAARPAGSAGPHPRTWSYRSHWKASQSRTDHRCGFICGSEDCRRTLSPVADPAAVGFRCHSGWAVLVVVSGSPISPVVLDRRRVELVDESLPRQPYHAVAEDGAPPSVIDNVADASRTAVAEALRSIARIGAVGVVATERQIPPDLDQILASHALLHAAEGHLFERAVIEAAHDAGLRTHVVPPKSIEVPSAIDALGRSIGPPWQKDHKWAATAALAALGSA